MSASLMAGPRLDVPAARPVDGAVAPVQRATAGAQHQPAHHPWTLDDLRRLVRTLAVSITALVVAWLLASGTTRLSYQEYAIAGAIVATALAVAGLAGWLLVGVRALRAERVRALTEVRAVIARRGGAAQPQPFAPPAHLAAGGGPVSAPGMSRYHDAACLMVRGKPVVQTAEETTLVPCPICLAADAS